ncbi:MAG: ferritin family protein [Myxococcales bacterium]|nr:ferritin family protein [Myxococcales bacterium]MDH5306581.1 ferritin family protein [Myxococcales bacterium]MDH5567923.1 ferritin family protein [Myxococcales bacterium]
MNSVDAILDFAIAREQEAVDFYTGLAGRDGKAWMRDLLLDFAREEARHKAKLLAVKGGQKLLSSEQRIADLKIADYLVDVEVADDIGLQDALIVAMKREKAAFRLYTDLAARVDDAELRALFLGLAQEEAKHKLYFETQYDERVLRNN